MCAFSASVRSNAVTPLPRAMTPETWCRMMQRQAEDYLAHCLCSSRDGSTSLVQDFAGTDISGTEIRGVSIASLMAQAPPAAWDTPEAARLGSEVATATAALVGVLLACGGSAMMWVAEFNAPICSMLHRRQPETTAMPSSSRAQAGLAPWESRTGARRSCTGAVHAQAAPGSRRDFVFGPALTNRRRGRPCTTSSSQL